MATKIPGAIDVDFDPKKSRPIAGAIDIDTTGATPDPRWTPPGAIEAEVPQGKQAAQPEKGTGFLRDVVRGGGQIAQTFGRTGEDLGLPGARGLKTFGQGVIDANPADVSSLNDIIHKPLETIKEGVAEALPQVGLTMAGAAGGAAIGAAAGAPFAGVGAAPGAVVGGLVGAFAPNLVQEYGGIRTSQDEQGIDKPGKALLGASAAAAIDMLGPEASIPRKAGVKILTKAGEDVGEGLVKRTLKGAAVEGATEGVQTGIERAASEQSLVGDGALDDYAVSAAKGAAGGGAVEMVGGKGKRQEARPAETPISNTETHDILQPERNVGPRNPDDEQLDLFPDSPDTSPLVGTITAAAKRHGVDPNVMLTIAQIESGMNPAARNPNSSAGGLYQFIDRTAQYYGLEDRFDPSQSSDAAARMTAESQDYLTKRLGRKPEPWELYLAHQQGPAGAVRLLNDYAANRPAADIVGRDAVLNNGGTVDMTARQFAELWKAKYEKAQAGRPLVDSSTQPGAAAGYDASADEALAAGPVVTVLEQMQQANGGKATAEVKLLAKQVDDALKGDDVEAARKALDARQAMLDRKLDKLDEEQSELDAARGEHSPEQHAKYQGELDQKLDRLIRSQNVLAVGRQRVDSYGQSNAVQQSLDFSRPMGEPLVLTQPTSEQAVPSASEAPAQPTPLKQGPRNGELFPAENASPTLFPEPTPQPVNPAGQTALADSLRKEAFDDADARAEASVRKSMLDQVLADSTTRDATKRFVALLKRTGRDPTLSDDESKALAVHANSDTTLGVPERAPAAAPETPATPAAEVSEPAPEAVPEAVRSERTTKRAEARAKEMGTTRGYWFQQGVEDVLRGENPGTFEPKSPPVGKTKARAFAQGQAFARDELARQREEVPDRGAGDAVAAPAGKPVAGGAGGDVAPAGQPEAKAKAPVKVERKPKGAKTAAAVAKVKAAKAEPKAEPKAKPNSEKDLEAFDGRVDYALSGRMITAKQAQQLRILSEQNNTPVKELDKMLDAAIDARAKAFSTQKQAITRRGLLAGAAALPSGVAVAQEKRTQLPLGTLRAIIKDGDLGKAITWLAAHTKNPLYADIARRLSLGGFGGATVEMVDVSKDSDAAYELDGAAGDTDMQGDKGVPHVRLVTGRADPTANGTSEQTLLHEAIHAWVAARFGQLSIYGIEGNRQLVGENADPLVAKAIAEWVSLWRSMGDMLKAAGLVEGDKSEVWAQQFTSNPDEALTWALTSPELQEYMRSVDPKGEKLKTKSERSLWDKFVDWLYKTLGLSRPAARTALSELMDAANSLIKVGTTVKPDNKFAGRVEQKLKSQMYVGPKAATANTSELAKAKVLTGAGRDREQTRQDTGWFTGADGLWRTEISDKGAKYRISPKTMDKGDVVYLDDLLHHPAFFRAYPEAKDIPVQMMDKAFVGGLFDPGTNSIELNHLYDDDKSIHSLLHELQHWVQTKEGFAGGSNPNEQPRPAAIDKAEAFLKRKLDAAQEMLDKRLARGRSPGVAQTMVDEAKEALGQIDDFRGVAATAEPLYVKLNQQIAQIEFTEGKDRIDQILAAKKTATAISTMMEPFRDLRHVMYQLSAGEREARDTAFRKEADEGARKLTRPYFHEGIRDSEVYNEHVGGVSYNLLDKAPEAIREPAKSLTTTMTGKAKQLALFMPFTEEVAAMAKKYIPSAQRFIELNSRSHALARKFEERLAEIKRDYQDLPAHLRGNGKGSVNDFLMASRMTEKWGFQPSYLKNVPVDAEMKAKFDKLPAAAQRVIRQVLHFNWEARRELMTAVVQTINAEFDPQIAEATTPEEKADLKDRKAEALKHFSRMHAARDDIPYSPLKRSGEWVVLGMSDEYAQAKQDGDGKTMAKLRGEGDHYWVNFYDSEGEAKAARERVKTKYPHTQHFQRSEVTDQDIGGKELYVAFGQLRSKIAKQMTEDPGDQTAKQLYRLATDLYLQSLADTSARKGELKADKVEARDPVTGEAIDMMKAFVTRGQATTHFVAAMHNGKEMHATLDAMEREAADIEGDRTEAERFRNELMWRYVHQLGRRPNRTVDKIVRGVSLWTLLMSPVYYAINLTQAEMFSVPMVAGRVGYAKAQAAFMRAYKDALPALKNASFKDRIRLDQLPKDVQGVMQFLTDRGRLDAGLANELGQWEMNGNGMLPKAFNLAGKLLANVPQNLETLNRIVTGIAAYRAAKAAGDSEQQAYDYAAKVVYDTHGDYSGFNEPRAMSQFGNTGKVVFQFQKFRVIMATLMAKMIHNSYAGATKEEKWIARKSLAFTLAHTVAASGLVGFPGAAAIGSLVVKALDAFDDDDKDWDNWEVELRKWLDAHAPKAIADLLYKGAPYSALKTDLSGRLGLGNMLSVAPYSDTGKIAEGDRDAMFTAAGQLAMGPLGSIAAKLVDALGFAKDGDIYRAVESAAPAGAVQGALKANRYANRGVETKGNATLIKPQDLDGLDLFLTTLGLNSQKLADHSEDRGHAFEQAEYYKSQTTHLKRRYLRAQKDGDTKAAAKVREEWGELQNARAKQGLKRQPLSTLLRAEKDAAKQESRTIEGVPYTPSTKGAVEQLVGG